MNKKIAIITPVWPPYRGGIGTVAYNQARVLREQGQDVTVLTPDYGLNHPPTPSLVKEGAFTLEYLKPVLKYGNAAWAPSLKKRLKEFDAVILQYPFFGGMRAVYKAKKKYGFKLIVNYNMDVVGRGLKGLVFWYATRYFLPRIINIADLALASSEDYAKHSDLGRYWDNNDPKFRVVPIGVDVTKFKPAQVDGEFRKNLNIKPEEKIILFVGGLDKAHYFKGVEYLIKAIRIIRMAPELSEFLFKVAIVGRGELQDKYRALAQELGVKDRVLFTGGVSDDYLVKLYQMAYITVLPSIDQSESFGIVLAESLSCGTPVIASDLPGVRSVFENNVSGFAVPPRDSQSLAERIKFILDNPDKAREMGRAGRRLVEERYDWSVIGDKLLKLI